MSAFSGQRSNLKGVLQQGFFNDPRGRQLIEDYINGKTKGIIVNLDDVADFDLTVANELITNAAKYGMSALEEAIIEIVANYGVNNCHIDKAHISVVGNKSVPVVFIHDIGANEIGRIVRVHGLVSKTGVIHPMYIQAVFKCAFCGAQSVPIIQENPWMMTKPFPKCEGCDERTIWEPLPECSEMANSQEFTVQESYDDISSNKMPRPIQCITFKEHLLNYMNCGDDADIIAIVLAAQLPRKFAKSSKFNTTYLDVLYADKKRKDPEAIVFSAEEEAQFVELSKDCNLYQKIIASFAPSIDGHENEKEAILLSIFGAPEEKREDITIRGNIHILMVGDPATAKSQLLRVAADLSPRGMFAMGRGASAAGLTAALTKSAETEEWEISAGVLVLADEGVACIDEIEKMREEDRVIMHPAMEQQIVKIDKAGVHIELKARTAVIAAANPTLGRYDIYKSVFENLPKFPPSLFSRFDLIFKVIDTPNKENDMRIASRILGGAEAKAPIERKILKRYISYSKRINPVLSFEAAEMLKAYYVLVRSKFNTDQKTFPLSARQFEALKRMTLARARSLLKKEADKSDVDAVKRLFDVFLQDTLSGDVTCQETGQDKSVTDLEKLIVESLRNKPMTKEDLRNTINCPDEMKFEKAFVRVRNDCGVYEKERTLDGRVIFAIP